MHVKNEGSERSNKLWDFSHISAKFSNKTCYVILSVHQTRFWDSVSMMLLVETTSQSLCWNNSHKVDENYGTKCLSLIL